MEGLAARRIRTFNRCDAPTVEDCDVIDRQVGARIRERRIMLGISQHEMARRLEVSYQQAHRYEKGTTRISAGTLHQLARLFDVEVDYFFAREDRPAQRDRSWQRLFIELARAFEQLQHDDQRRVILELSRFLAQISLKGDAPVAHDGRRGALSTVVDPRLTSRQLDPLFEHIEENAPVTRMARTSRSA